MNNPTDLLHNNQQWADRLRDEDPERLEEMAKGQSPEYLWIGCADSRVPATQVVDLAPGDMFVHRNVANVVLHSDLNCQSVLQYAVQVLKVSHIIVCGHYSCGGVTAAIENQRLGLIDHWLRHVKDIYKDHIEEINAIEDQQNKINRLCEINVQAQVLNVCHSPFVQEAWQRDQDLSVHGWIYSLQNGRIEDLDISVSSVEETSSIYQV